MFRQSLRALAILGAIAASAGWATTASAGLDTAADQAKLQAEALSWFDFYAKVDAEALANLYAEDAVLMPPGAPAVTGRSAIRSFLAGDAANTKAGGFTLKNASVTGMGVAGDCGWISGTFTVVDASGVTVDSGNYLSVHQRTNGVWLYIRDIWNSDRPVTPPAPSTKTAGKK